MEKNKNGEHHVLVVGGGFGGIKTALELGKQRGVTVTLLSDQKDFRYYPTLFHTATGGLQKQSSIPLEKLVPGKHITVAYGKAEKLDREKKTVTTADGQVFPFDTLVLALGVVTSYFGIPGIEQYSYSIKSLEEALRFKNHLHDQLSADGKPDENYVVVGGGPTGIELAAALPSYLRRIMAKHGIKNQAVNVVLIETSPRLLPRSSGKTSSAVQKRLESLGVKLELGKAVQSETADSLTVSGEEMKTSSVVWTAGMSNNPFFEANKFALNERRKVIVNEYMQAEPGIYVLGDNAATTYSGMAQTALHDAIFVSKNIARRLAGTEAEKYHAKEPISVVPAGPIWASVDWGKMHLHGPLGWVMRQGADAIAFYDFGWWIKALLQLTTEFGHEETCPICHK